MIIQNKKHNSEREIQALEILKLFEIGSKLNQFVNCPTRLHSKEWNNPFLYILCYYGSGIFTVQLQSFFAMVILVAFGGVKKG